MKKNKLSTAKRKASAKTGQKRAVRLKKTREEKYIKKTKSFAEKKAKEKKFQEAMQKMLESRGIQPQTGL